jgi:cephalosporin-C deacetylase-like acetyl esterase
MLCDEEIPMTARSEVRFPVDDGVELGAWLDLPKSDAQRCPAITMAHGYAGVKELGIARFAEAFADSGFVVLHHDHRTFGISGGEPRQDVDPWRQVADWHRAISYLEPRAEIDPKRIGPWGTNYAGGHALVLAATDRRIACVVSQVPTISSYQQRLRRVAPEGVAALEAPLNDDKRAQLRSRIER